LHLAPEEPEARPWRVQPLTEVIEILTARAPGRYGDGRPFVLGVDGRSSSGKTTLAARMLDAVGGSVVVHTDDLAWWHSRFGWADLLIDGVLTPLRRGGSVAFRPEPWVERGRLGSIDVPAGCPLLLVEGVGAGRREVTGLIDALVWVQSDEREAERRNLARVGRPGGPLTVRALRDWMAEEIPFLAAERAWERADLVVSGTPELSHDPITEIVVAPPPIADRERAAHQLVDIDGLAGEFLAGMQTALGRFDGIDRRDTSLETLMALTQIIQALSPPDDRVSVEDVVTDIDTVVRQARFTGWSQTESGDRTIRFEIREVLKRYGLPTTGPLFDRVHACIRANY
jgi:hypothetical protein